MPEPKPGDIVYTENGSVAIGAPIAKMDPREKPASPK